MSDNKYNPTIRGAGTIQLPEAPPVAVITIVLSSRGEVAVQLQGPPDRLLLRGVMGEALELMLRRITQAAEGPKIEAAPPGLKID